MRRDQVIAVQAVFHQQLPVGFHRVLVGAANHPHPCFRLVHDQVKVFSCVRQVRNQVLHVRIETHEVEPPVALNPGRFSQAQLAPVEVRPVCLLVRHADQVPVHVERPRVIEALQYFGVPLVPPADQRAAVRA